MPLRPNLRISRYLGQFYLRRAPLVLSKVSASYRRTAEFIVREILMLKSIQGVFGIVS
jgi:hypothetical protein